MRVYVIEGNNRVKVGFSQSPHSRMASLQPNVSDELKLAFQTEVLPNFRLVERLAHKLLKPKRVKGEWFKVTVEQAVEVIKRAIWITEHQQEDEYLIIQPYKYKTTTVSIMGDSAVELEQLRNLVEKRLNTRLSLAKVIRLMVRKELAHLEADPTYLQQ